MSTKVNHRFCRVTIRRDSVTNRQNLYAIKEDGTCSETYDPSIMSKALEHALLEQFEKMSNCDEIEIILLKKGVFNG